MLGAKRCHRRRDVARAGSKAFPEEKGNSTQDQEVLGICDRKEFQHEADKGIDRDLFRKVDTQRRMQAVSRVRSLPLDTSLTSGTIRCSSFIFFILWPSFRISHFMSARSLFLFVVCLFFGFGFFLEWY